MCPDLVIQTLGSTAIWIGEDAIHERVSVKAQALLIYLAVTRQTHTREALAEFLWESRAPGQALTNLRKIIIQLQSIVPYLCITRRAMGLNPDHFYRLDAAESEREIAAVDDLSPPLCAASVARLEAAVARYQGDFLAELPVDSQAFQDWSLLERERLRVRAMTALDLLIEHGLLEGTHDTTLQHVFHLLKLDPLRETSYRQAMRLLVQMGQRENALRQYMICQRILEHELGVAPSTETTALYRQIRDSAARND